MVAEKFEDTHSNQSPITKGENNSTFGKGSRLGCKRVQKTIIGGPRLPGVNKLECVCASVCLQRMGVSFFVISLSFRS